MQTFFIKAIRHNFFIHPSVRFDCTREAHLHFVQLNVFPFLISSFSREISTELVFLIQHMLAVFSGLIGPESSRDVPRFYLLAFCRFSNFSCARSARCGVPISCGRNFSVSFDRREASVFLDFKRGTARSLQVMAAQSPPICRENIFRTSGGSAPPAKSPRADYYRGLRLISQETA